METPIDYALLVTFVAVADAQSFSRAAARLGVGKGTVSRSIARLEGAVGAALLHRTTHRVALSTAGAALYERTAPLLSRLEEAVQGLPDASVRPSGLLRITAPHDFAAVALPSLLTSFLLRYPEVRADVRVTNGVVDLVSESIDVAIRAGSDRPKDSSLISRRLGAALGYFAAPSYLARRGEPHQVGQADHDWVAFAPFHVKGARDEAAPRAAANDFLLLAGMLCEGAGVGPLPLFVAEPHVAAGRLVPTRVKPARPFACSFSLVYTAAGRSARKVQVFRDFMLERWARLEV